ncbi:MAG: phosphoribosylformylglycinamidine cyclo-ligase [Syntrophobacterales bacterium]|nr:phosphoribosylformylglycinamidine cyclo-ligase [Syntrophobacterales bacterium]
MAGGRYKEAGVDLEKAVKLVDRIKPFVQKTMTAGAKGEFGSFGGFFSINCNEIKNPVLVASTDGVGTKLKIAFMARKYDTVGIDLVAMCVNDILVHGAKPLFFLDYVAMSKIDLDVLEAIISGIAKGCKEASCALIGGETAEMPDFYPPGEFDLAGFAVGVADEDNIIDGSGISFGDIIIGLESNGLHSNGYSLVRKIIFDHLGYTVDTFISACGATVTEELLRPTKIYVPVVLRLLRKQVHIKGMVHITGGGFLDNIPRVLPQSCQAVISKRSWPVPPIFSFLQEVGSIDQDEMFRVFNNGIGFIIIADKKSSEIVLEECQVMNVNAYKIGVIEQRRDPGTSQVVITD